MTVRLRPHHLLCLLTYVGKGYTPDFVENYDSIVQRLSSGEDIIVVDDPDDICEALMCEREPHCLGDSVRTRDKLAATELAGLLGLTVSTGVVMQLRPALVDRMRKAFKAGLIRSACNGCEWSKLCSEIAVDSYARARLR